MRDSRNFTQRIVNVNEIEMNYNGKENAQTMNHKLCHRFTL